MSSPYAQSPLCARHDGTMLGFLFFMCRFQFAQERFPVFRMRMEHLLDGIDADVRVPATHDEFVEGWSPLFEQVLYALTEKDEGVNEPLFRPFALGSGFLAVGLDMPNQTDIGMLTTIMETDLGLPMSLLEEHAAAVPEIGDETSIDDVMSPALAFLRDLLEPLDPEPDTCFVAMPFSEPFEEQYAAVYRPMMSGVGYRTLRAWGGLASEAHVDLLLTLIDKSGALLAELTGLNPNVAFELGYAYGRDKAAIPMCDSAQPLGFANIHGLAILPYDSSSATWRDDMLQGLGNLILRSFIEVWRQGAEDSASRSESP
jgi:hypothetical protein